ATHVARDSAGRGRATARPIPSIFQPEHEDERTDRPRRAKGTPADRLGERRAEACDLRWGERVLDVAAGNGNATLAAARRGCKVTSTDYVPALLERGAQRARAEGLTADFLPADAEALPFEAATFDCV